MIRISLLISLVLVANITFCQTSDIEKYHTSDSLTNLVINAGDELRIASNHLYASIGASILSAGCMIGSLYIPEDAPRDGSGKTVLRTLGYGSALASTLFLISGIGHIDKAGISLSEYGVGLKVPINGKK